MINTKYVVSEGIAFSEMKDLKMLKKHAAEGWVVKRYKGMGYELELGEPEHVDFSIDVHKVTKEDEDEYFAMFEFAGWEHVCSNGDTHLFKAPVGTEPIYSDNETKKEKLVRLQEIVQPAFVMSLIATIIAYALKFVSTGVLEVIFTVVFVLCLALLLPCVCMIVALTYRRMKLQ